MKAVYETMRILVVLLVIGNVLGQNDYADQNNVRKEQIASEKSEVDAITVTYNPNSYSTGSVLNVQINGASDAAKNIFYNQNNRGRIRKIFRIKNPFLRTEQEDEEVNKQSLKLDTQDSDTGASNQYAAMQYSLPPEEFLQKFRAENQYYQQQQQQVSTPAPTFVYTATPQPQYYSTTSATNFNNDNEQKASLNPLESNNPPQVFNPNYNNYHYNNGYAFGIDAIQSTPSSVTLYLSTKLPSNQYIGTPSSTYVSSPSPIYQSSPSNLQSYGSSTLSNIQLGSPNYNNNNRHSTAVENNSFNYGANRGNDQNIYVNHYGNSVSGVHHPLNIPQYHQNEFPSSTQIPIISTTISDNNRDSWQNSFHYNLRSVPSTRQEFTQSSQVNLIENNQQETIPKTNVENQNTGNNGVASMQSANNLFLSFARPEYQAFNKVRNDHDMESQQTTQTDVYSYGDYGWKQDGRKAIIKYDVSSPPNYHKQESLNYPAGTNYLSTQNRNIDNSKMYDYNQKSKLNSEKLDGQDFAKAAAKALQNMKKQQQELLNSYSSQISHLPDNSIDSNGFSYKNLNENNEVNFVTGNPNTHTSTLQYDLITASPYYLTNTRENILGKNDISSVTPDITQNKFHAGANSNVGYNSTNIGVNEQNFKQNLKTFQVPNYNDNNVIYNYNARMKPEEKPLAFSSYRMVQHFDNQKQYESPHNANSPYPNSLPNFIASPANYLGQSTLYNLQQQNNLQQQIGTRPQIQENNDGVNNYKINDIPHWLVRDVSSGNLRMNNNFDNGMMSTVAPLMLNQNVDAHQLDVAASILSKLIREKQGENSKPEYNSQAGPLLPTINGLKIVNPYNLDLNLVAEILKGRPFLSDVSYNQVNQQLPFRWDPSQLQHLMLKNDNIMGSPNGLGTVSFTDMNNNGGVPYQGVKYSRSQEEEESLVPITDASLIYPIGAVIEQDVILRENREENDSDMAGSNDEEFPSETGGEKSHLYSGHRLVSRNRPPNSFISENQYHHHRKYPKMNVREPYPLLRPPPPHSLNGRYRKNPEHINRRQRHNKLKVSRIVKREPMFEDEDLAKDDQQTVPILLRPPPITAEDKAGTTQSDNN